MAMWKQFEDPLVILLLIFATVSLIASLCAGGYE